MAKSSTDFYELLGSYDFTALVGDHSHIKNGHLISLFYKENKSQKETLDKFCQHFNFAINKAALRQHLRKVSSDVARFKKKLNNTTQWNNLVHTLEQEYTLPVSDPQPTPLVTEIDDSQPRSDNTYLHVQSSTPVKQSSAPAFSLVSPIPAATPSKRLRTDCNKCDSRRTFLFGIVNKNKNMKATVAKARLRLQKNKQLSQSLLRKSYVESHLRQERKALRRKVKSLQSKGEKDEVASLRQEIRFLKRKKAETERNLRKKDLEIKQYRSEIRALKKEICELKDQSDYLTSIVLEEGKTPDNKIVKEAKQYDITMRKTIYKSLLSQVPVSQAGEFINYALREIGNKTISSLPHKSTVARMAYELSALTLLQAGEALLTTDAATLCWDATTLDATHINEIHISTPSQTLTVSLTRLPGGRANDYVNHVMAVINELANTWAAYNKDIDYLATKRCIISKIKSTMSDRAPVNHAVVGQLKTVLETDLVELFCNLHPLDGFANHARRNLLQLDRELGVPNNGRQCAAESFIYTVSKLRYKQTGDPVGFKSFLKRNNIPAGAFTRYVGNRMHVLFHLAGFIVQYATPLQEYLERYCRNESAIRTNLLKYITDQTVLCQLVGLGLCGKIITGPWMRLFYHTENRTNLDMVPFLKECCKSIKTFRENVELMFTCTLDAFGQPLQDDDTLSSLRAAIQDGPLVKRVLTCLLDAFDKVFNNQLSGYVSGPLSNVTNTIQEDTKSASPNNIWAERSLGMADALWRRAPNASVGFLDAKVKAKTNKVLDWLDKKTSKDQRQLVSFAVKRGAFLRKANMANERMVGETTELRLTELAQTRDKKMRRKLEKGVKEALLQRDVNHDIFSSVDGCQREWLIELVQTPDRLKGSLIRHTWEDDMGVKISYWGRIRDCLRKPRQSHPVFVIGYWAEGQLESSSEDYEMQAEAVIADIITGDLLFM